MSRNKECIAKVIYFISNKIQVNDQTVKDTYREIIFLLNGNIPDDTSVTIRNDQNQDVNISINDHPDFLVYRFYEAINRSKLNIFDSVVEVNTSSILKDGLPEHLLLLLIARELQSLRDYLKRALTESSDEKVNEFFEIRIGYLLRYIAKNEGQVDFDRTSIKDLIELINFQINTAIRRGDIIDKLTLLKGYLTKEVNNEIKKNIFFRYIDISKEYMVESKDELINLYYEYKKLFNEVERDMVLYDINSDPSNITIFSLRQGGGNTLKNSDGIITVIRFIASGKIVNDKFDDFFTIGIGDKKLIGKKMISYLDDPIVGGLNFGGLKTQYISDFSGSKDLDNIELQLQLNDFLHPQFDMDGEQIIEKKFDREERLEGRQYHPLKRVVIQFLLDAKEKLNEVFEIPDSDFDINLFSNYSVEYLDKLTKKHLYHRKYFFTNPGSFVSSRKNYFDRLSKLNFSATFLRVRQLIDDTKIVTEQGLQHFIIAMLKIVVKESVELSGNYKYFWTSDKNGDKTPQREVDMQPLILNQLRLLLEFKGINISKEPEYSNGKLDFECSFNSDSKLFKCAIEIKNAHHDDIIDGVSKQLPQYMKQTGKYGIFCFLWYKGNKFKKPRKYSNLEELKDHLINEIPEGFIIEVLGINCNKGQAPSTL